MQPCTECSAEAYQWKLILISNEFYRNAKQVLIVYLPLITILFHLDSNYNCLDLLGQSQVIIYSIFVFSVSNIYID